MLPALLTTTQMRELDRLAINEVGIPSLVLMELAGRAVADRVATLATSRAIHKPILALAGLGNNGGDAVVAARHLRDRGFAVNLMLTGEASRVSPDLAQQLTIARELQLRATVIEPEADLAALFGQHALVIDGIIGTGLSRTIEGSIANIIDAANASGLPIVAIDVPSGINSDTGQIEGSAVRATVTVALQYAKLGHVLYPGREHTGKLVVADISIPRVLLSRVGVYAEQVEDVAIMRALPPRPADTHKGTYGHVLVVAGTPERPGSALLVARAAMRAGAGLTTVASDEETVRRLAPVFDELMGLSLGKQIESDAIIEALETRNVLAIGPSLAADARTKKMILDVLAATHVPAVIDAGALAALGRDVIRLKGRRGPVVLTPHPGEMAALAGVATQVVQRDRVKYAVDVATQAGAFVVLKGASSVIASPDGKVGIVTRGNAGMATGGAGDVLTGVIAGLLAQKIDTELAVRAGVLLHAKAGDRAALRGEARLVASDIIDALLVEGTM